MTKTKLAMIFILVAVVLAWLLSGILTSDPPVIQPSLAEAKEARTTTESDLPLATVRAKRSTASEQSKTITFRGRTIDKNKATVTAETSGRIVSRPVDIGEMVSEGDILCQIAANDRIAKLDQTKDALTLAKKEYESSLKLSEQNFQQELATARFKAAFSAAQAQLVNQEIELENTAIRAPISGIVHEVHANVGEYMQIGFPCATILVLNPIYAEAFITEEHIGEVRIGDAADVTLPNGLVLTGLLTFVSRQADDQTRTFRVEVELDNADYEISSGLSATLQFSNRTYYAHKVPTSVLVLDEFGNLGIKSVDDDNRVEFHGIEIVREDQDGVWVTGLPNRVNVINVGQGLVVADEHVAVQFIN